MIIIAGSDGEGGGQTLHSALTLACVTGRSVRIENVRGNRPRPGLMRQHLTALQATTAICKAATVEASLGSRKVEFRPETLRNGSFEFAIATAGSTSLVLQTIFPALLSARGESRVRISGDTHNPAAPTFEFLQEAYIPALRAMGHEISADIQKYGFYPVGGGQIEVLIEPAQQLRALELEDRGTVLSRSTEAVIANLSGSIAERELRACGNALEVPEAMRQITTRTSAGPGNVLYARLHYENLSASFAEAGEHNVSAEQVAKRVAKSIRQFANSDAAVTHRLADQLFVPLADASRPRGLSLRH